VKDRRRRRLFLTYFESEGHYPLQSARLNPYESRDARGDKHALNFAWKIKTTIDFLKIKRVIRK